MLQIGRNMRGKKFPAVTKPLHVRGYDDCFQDRAERALWQLSLILAEIASNTSGDKDLTESSHHCPYRSNSS